MGPLMAPPDTPKADDFLSRWARQKRAQDQPDAEEASAAEPVVLSPDAPPDMSPTDADPDLLASLPRIEDIAAGTDVRGFLQAGVPRTLRNAALRRAWATHPVISTYEDPARDYFWDYNAEGGVAGFGGKISADAVNRMARAITGEVDPDPEAPAAAAHMPGCTSDLDAEPKPQPRPDAGLAPDLPDTADTVAAAPVPPDPPRPAPPERPAQPERPAHPRPRRHGGAMPG